MGHCINLLLLHVCQLVLTQQFPGELVQSDQKKKKRFHYHVRVSISLTSREANLSLAFYILVLPPLSCCSYLGG